MSWPPPDSSGIESAAIFQLLWETDTLVIPKIINITVSYLRSAKLQDVFAQGVVTKRARRVMQVSASAWQEDRQRPVANAQAHFLLTRPGGGHTSH